MRITNWSTKKQPVEADIFTIRNLVVKLSFRETDKYEFTTD